MINSELLPSIKKHTDIVIEQTRSRLQETLEFKLKKRKGNVFVFPFN